MVSWDDWSLMRDISVVSEFCTNYLCQHLSPYHQPLSPTVSSKALKAPKNVVLGITVPIRRPAEKARETAHMTYWTMDPFL